jgi:hypothetical protein
VGVTARGVATMRMHALPTVLIAVGLALPATAAWSQVPRDLSRNSLVDVLVWGADVTIDWTPYARDVRAEAQRYRQRFQSYGARRRPPRDPELQMVHAAHLRYERTLAAVSDEPRARTSAAEFVERLKPCYEWEGYHDCPEHEARFAAEYQAANPRGPFRDYLPLLAAHRWLCAAEAYEYEDRPEDATRSRREFNSALSTARRSAALLVRTAAEELGARGRCFASDK